MLSPGPPSCHANPGSPSFSRAAGCPWARSRRDRPKGSWRDNLFAKGQFPDMTPRFTVARALLLTTALGWLAARPVEAASLQAVSNWGASGVPSYISMYIYVPD